MNDLTQRKPVVGNTDYPTRVNGLIDDLQVAASAPVPPYGSKGNAAWSGLTWAYYGGQRWINGVLTTIADATLLLTASVTNYVEYTDAGVVSANNIGFSADKNPIAEITTGASSITTFLDRRSQRDSATGRLSKSVAGGTDVTLTAAEARNDILEFTGVLTGNINVIVPTRARAWVFSNQTSGAFTLAVKPAAGTGIAITQGKRAVLYCDATNVISAFDDPALLAASSSPFSDAGALVKANADATRLLKVIAGGIATGTTRNAFSADEDSTIGVDWYPKNLTVVCSRTSSAETIALKDKNGNDFSAANPLIVKFRNATAGTGDYTSIALTAAHSLVLSSGSVMGASNGVAFRLWLVLFNDAGTMRLGAVNCLSGTNIMGLKDDDLLSSTAEGGAGAADNAQTVYTGTAVTSKAMRIIGYLEYTLATVGTWNTAPSKIQLFGPSVPLPGQLVQEVSTFTGAFASGSAAIPQDDTIPQNTEGDQYMSLAITPKSAVNVLELEYNVCYSTSASGVIAAALFQDSTANALTVSGGLIQAAGGYWGVLKGLYRMVAATTSSTTIKTRAGKETATTFNFNGAAGGRQYGGAFGSYMKNREIMA